MPKYRVLEQSFINHSLYGPDEPAGDVVELPEGTEVSANLQLIEEPKGKGGKEPALA